MKFSLELLSMAHLAIYSTGIGVNPASAAMEDDDRSAQKSGPSTASRDAKSNVIEAFMEYHGDHFEKFAEALTNYFMQKSRILNNMQDTAPTGGGNRQKMAVDRDGRDAGGVETMLDLPHGGGFLGSTGAVFKAMNEDLSEGDPSIEEIVDEWRLLHKTKKMFHTLKKVKNVKEMEELLDGVGDHANEGRDPVFDWAATVVNPSKIPSVIDRKAKGLDAGWGLFAREKIPAMKVVAILTDGSVAEKPTDFAEKGDGEEVLMVRRKAGNFSNLYQRGAVFRAAEPVKGGEHHAWNGWCANSPSDPGMANCVAIAACAGADRWFSFLLSVKRIKKGEEILSNALPFNEEWEEKEEEEKEEEEEEEEEEGGH
jgi:hypothetical protein